MLKKRYAKHYYINNKRFASRIGLIDDNFVSAGARMINSLANQKTQIQPIENVVQLDNQYVTYGAAENTTPDDYPDCSSQLQALLEELNPTSNPTKAHCYQYVLDRMNANSNPCVALEEVNKYICEEIEVPEPDPGTPTYTPEQIDQADCLYLLNLWIVMANGLLYDENDRYYINKCYDAGLRYIQNNYVSSPSNVCEVYKYIIENYKCEPEQELETPTEPIKIPIDWVDEGANSNTIEPGYDEGLRKPIWWYHTDHLGSSSYITDNFGRPSHYYDQLPFGESMVEHNQSSYYNNGYKFNGKELDEATGMYYYGARYYDPRISIFISVDPLAEQTMEPYLYTGNNPIMFTDPTGMSKDHWIKNIGTNQVEWREEVTSRRSTPQGYRYLGERYKGIKIHKFRTFSGNGVSGVMIKLSYKDDKNRNADVRFVQTVRTNSPLGGVKSPYNDPQPPDDNKPFYHTDAEIPDRSCIDDENLTFFDTPRRHTNKDSFWKGELSLVKNEGKGYESEITLDYGFEISNGKVSTEGIKVKENLIFPNTSGESYFQNKTINDYNKSQIGPRKADGTF